MEIDGHKINGYRIIKCDKCGDKFLALCNLSTERLECAKCGNMVQVVTDEGNKDRGTCTFTGEIE